MPSPGPALPQQGSQVSQPQPSQGSMPNGPGILRKDPAQERIIKALERLNSTQQEMFKLLNKQYAEDVVSGKAIGSTEKSSSGFLDKLDEFYTFFKETSNKELKDKLDTKKKDAPKKAKLDSLGPKERPTTGDLLRVPPENSYGFLFLAQKLEDLFGEKSKKKKPEAGPSYKEDNGDGLLGGLGKANKSASGKTGKFGQFAKDLQEFGKGLIYIAAALIIMAGAFAIITMLPMDWGKILTATTIILAYFGLAALATKIAKPNDVRQFAESMLILSVAMVIASVSFLIMGLVDWNKAIFGVVSFVVIMGGFAIAAMILNNMGGTAALMQLAIGMAILSGALLLASIAFLIMNQVDWMNALIGSTIFLVIMGVFAAVGYAAAAMIPGLAILGAAMVMLSVSILIFSVALLVMGPAIAGLQGLDVMGTFFGIGMGLISLIPAAIASPFLLMLAFTLLPLSISLMTVAKAVEILGGVDISKIIGKMSDALWSLNGIDFSGMEKLKNIFSPGLLMTLGALGFVIDPLVRFADAVKEIAEALYLLSGMSDEEIRRAMDSLREVLKVKTEATVDTPVQVHDAIFTLDKSMPAGSLFSDKDGAPIQFDPRDKMYLMAATNTPQPNIQQEQQNQMMLSFLESLQMTVGQLQQAISQFKPTIVNNQTTTENYGMNTTGLLARPSKI